MSVRPQEAAETASRFSLRSVFAGSFEEPLESSCTQRPLVRTAMQVPALNIAANPNSALKFTLPQVRSNAALGGAAIGEKPGRQINAGFLSGGMAQTSQETLRLNGMIADLHPSSTPGSAVPRRKLPWNGRISACKTIGTRSTLELQRFRTSCAPRSSARPPLARNWRPFAPVGAGRGASLQAEGAVELPGQV